MDKDAYIKQLEAEVAKIPAMRGYIETLEKRIQELERRLGMNSQNSSKPPSSDPPGAAVVLPRRRRRKRGARKGHPPHLRVAMPPEMVTKRHELSPHACPCGSTDLEKTDEEPLRHQIVDIPPIQPEVTEYVQPLFRCKNCGEMIYQCCDCLRTKRILKDFFRRSKAGKNRLNMKVSQAMGEDCW